MSSDESPRTTYKKALLEQLRTSGFDPSVVGSVEKALDQTALDHLFVTASTALTASSPPIAYRLQEWYFGDAATAFAEREKRGSGVVVHGSVHGVVAGGGISDSEVRVAGTQVNVSAVSIARDILRDFQSQKVETTEGERLLDRVEATPVDERTSLLLDFVAWAKRHAGELTSNGLALLSILISIVR